MKILHLFSGTASSHLPWAEDLIAGLLAEEQSAGHQVVALATDTGYQSGEVLLRQPTMIGEVAVVHFPVNRWAKESRVPLIRRFAISTSLFAAAREAAKGSDVVHIHTIFPFPCVAMALWCKHNSIPFVVSLHGNLDPYMDERRSRVVKAVFMAAMGRRALNSASAIHFVSEGEERQVVGHRLTAPTRIISLGLDLSRYDDARSTVGFRGANPTLAKARIVAYLGRISYSKGLDVLARAFNRVAAEVPDAHLVLIGPDFEGYRPKVEAELAPLCKDRVHFTGRLTHADKVAALADADVVVMPSYSEAFGFAILEALALGRPVVVSDRCALASELELEGAALVARLKDDHLADQILALLADPPRRERLGQAGRKLIERRFTWPLISAQFIDLYERIVRSRERVE